MAGGYGSLSLSLFFHVQRVMFEPRGKSRVVPFRPVSGGSDEEGSQNTITILQDIKPSSLLIPTR